MLSHLFLYNQLKTGMSYHNILRIHNPIFVARGRVDGYALWKIGGTVPAAIKQEHSVVWGELWVVNPACLVRLDQFEYVKDGSFERVLVRFSPVDFYRDRTPFLVEMYEWQQGTSQKDSAKVRDGVLV